MLLSNGLQQHHSSEPYIRLEYLKSKRQDLINAIDVYVTEFKRSSEKKLKIQDWHAIKIELLLISPFIFYHVTVAEPNIKIKTGLGLITNRPHQSERVGSPKKQVTVDFQDETPSSNPDDYEGSHLGDKR